ncbi:MAG TPA: hypothetical protein VKT83_00055 [bacterium]|nr:hypothetical protein [bacterium]
MMKFLTTALGGLTILTVTGLATAQGQAMLGIRQPQAAVPVSVIADPGPAKVAVPAPQPVNAAPAAAPVAAPPAAAPAPAARPAVTSPAPVARPVARPAAASPAPGANPMGAIGGAGAITNILLNLPQVLQGGQGGPDGPAVNNGGGWGPPGQRGRDNRKRHGGDNNGGDYER